MKKYLPIASVVGVLFIGLLGFLVGQSGLVKGYSGVKIPGSNQISSDILLLTQPVTNFSGKVDKVEGNAIWVSQQFIMSQPYNMAPPITTPGQPPPAPPTPLPPKTVSYKILIGTNTQINRPPVFVAYLLITPPPIAPEKLTVKNIKAGQFVNVNSNADLRTLSGNEFTAGSIQLPQIQNSINGKISSVSGNTVMLKAFPPSQNGPAGAGIGAAVNGTIAPPKEVTYTVTVTDATEISRYGQAEPPKEGVPSKGPVPEKLAVGDLKTDMQITVFTDVDVTLTQKFTALRIEPVIVITPPPAQAIPPVNPPTIAVPPKVTTGTGNPTTIPAVPPVTSNTTTNSPSPKPTLE